MRLHLRKFILPFLFSLIFPAQIFADSVTLKSGKIIEGKIIQQTNEYIEITTSVGVSVKYYSDEIQTVQLDNPGSINNESTSKTSSPDTENPNSNIGVTSNSTENVPVPQTESAPEKTPPLETIPANPQEPNVSSNAVIQKQEVQAGAQQKNETQEKTDNAPKNINTLNIETDQMQNVFDPYSQKKVTVPKGENYMEYQKEVKLKEYKSKMDKLKDFLYQQSKFLWENYFSHLTTTQWIVIVICAYFIVVFPLVLIAGKMESKYAFITWFPPMLFITPILIAEQPVWWVFLLFVPIVNIFIILSAWITIAQYLQKSALWGFLMLFPGINILVVWYLALCPEKPIWIAELVGKEKKQLTTPKISSKGIAPQVYTKKPKNSRF